MYCIKSNYLLILQSRTGTVDKFGLLATTKKNAKTLGALRGGKTLTEHEEC